jgi:hypothetical protein
LIEQESLSRYDVHTFRSCISDIIFKVGHFTLDNAANNKTMMENLKKKLEERDIAFDEVDHPL